SVSERTPPRRGTRPLRKTTRDVSFNPPESANDIGATTQRQRMRPTRMFSSRFGSISRARRESWFERSEKYANPIFESLWNPAITQCKDCTALIPHREVLEHDVLALHALAKVLQRARNP